MNHRLLPTLFGLALAVSPGLIRAATFTVTTTGNSGAGSLHQAILDANAAPGADVIAFDIATAGKTITPPGTAALPTITDTLTIDGTTQPGFAGVPLIELNGASGPALSNGLLITASDCVIRGLVINRWKGDGIEIQGGTNNVVEGCFIGVSLAGTADQGNALSGVYLNGSANNRIGGTTAAQRNVISGNEDHGVRIEGAASAGNIVQGNFIGLNAAGTAALRNTDHGVSVEGAVSATIGGTAEGAGNVVSGNGQRGVSVTGGAVGCVIQGNVIGLNAAGDTDLGNTQDGIHVAGADDTLVGGTAAAARNVISGNNSDGIELNGATTTDTLIQGNLIGLRSSGAATVNNSTHGVFVNGAVNSTIGGTAAGAGNVISGNSQNGVAVAGATTVGVLIQGNLIGLDTGGTQDLGNTQDGINVNGVAGAQIGGTSAGAGNIIAGNNGDGIELTGTATQNTVIEGNIIGREGVPNAGAGILISSSAAKNRVGGVAAGQANTISFNTGDGVFISGGPENPVRGNSLHTNGGLGIDLGGNGVQPNDTTDADTGANLLQNFPVLTEAVLRTAATEVKGSLQSIANATFTLDFYGNDSADASGNGEGQTWLGSTDVTTDATGLASIAVNVAVTAQRFVSATATDGAGNTSEFSAVRRAVTTAAPTDFAVTTTDDSGPGSLRQAILDANTALNEGDRVVFNIPGAGPHTIAPVTALPGLSAPVTLDGYTQPGATPNTLAEGFNATLKIILDGNAAPSSTDGLRIEAPRGTVRGLVLNRWKGEGIEILAAASASVLEGNIIGLGLDSTDQGQNSYGVLVSGSAGNRIGGPAPAQRNVISGNNNHGILLNGAGARDNLILGNFLGTDLAGTARVVNSGDGVHITSGAANRIGGPAPGEGNVIGGNNSEGVELENANGTVVQGNRIGVAFNGAEIRNGGHGVQLNNASDTLIGGSTAGTGNFIARNSGRGITLLNNTSQRNSFRGNSIFANGNIGIDLFNNGRTLNDAGDADTGPNGLQNFPELASAVTEAAATRVAGSLNGAPGTVFTLEFFSSTEADSTGFGEGEQFLGATEVTTDAGGNAAFDLSLPVRAIGRIITATATGAEGTSEFSASFRATSTIPPTTFTVTTVADEGPGSLRQALLDADRVMTGAPHHIVFNIPGDGPHTISPANALPTPVSEPVEIDGFTQPGASANTLADGFNAVHRIVLDGTAAPFNADGLRFTTDGNIVRGLVIMNFRDDGVQFEGDGNAVEGCLLGLGLDGTARSNFRGVRITGTATGNRVGGSAPAARNVIAGNTVSNIEITSSVGANRVLGNFLGLLPAGNTGPATSDLFSGTGTGVYIQNSPDNVIGGAEPGAGNVIGGHVGMGVEVRDAAAARNRILGNRIGTDVTGQLPVPNNDGVWVVDGPGTVVGGPAAGEGNRVAFNRFNGVKINGFSAQNENLVRGNSITGNGALGINLGFDGVLENDPGDADDGANRHQNFPVLTAATAAAGTTTIQGTLNSVASRTYQLDLFANVACDASGNGEGDQYLGSTTVTTGTDGNGTFDVTVPVTVVGRFLTATATDPDGNTSEFSDCFEATTQFGSETFVVTNTNDSGDGSLRDALLRNNASVAGVNNRIEFNIPGDGPHVIAPATILPAISHAVTIDGYTQPGARANTLADGGDAVLKIHLQATQNFGGVGLELNATGSLVRGLALTKWFTAILLNGAHNTVQGCFVGLDPAGEIGGNLNSIALNLASGTGHRVGGTAPAERNLISGNGTPLQVVGSDAVIEGNWFGLDPSGRLARGNTLPIQISGNNHRFGGSEDGSRNVVAATAADGLRLSNANDCLVSHNFIGTDATGLVERGNQGVGLVVTGGSAGNQILGNLIGGNSGAGLQSFGETVILGNRIGESLDATTPLPNGIGVFLNGSGNRLGGVAPGEANVIAHNRGDGVLLTGTGAVENPIRGNAITGNTGLGINLGFDGVTPNDMGDGDTGPNGLQNFPEITAATVHGSTVEVAGTLDSTASTTFTLDFYADREADGSGFGEGRQYLGSTTVNTAADGHASFTATFNTIALGRWLTATATDQANNTSEFSRALRADTTRPGGTFTVTSAGDSGPGTLRQAILDASEVMAGTPHLIRFDIPAAVQPAIARHFTLPPGVRTIALKSALPLPDEAVVIDGFTQPGASANTAEERDDALRLIHLDAAGLPFGSPGLGFHRAGSTVRGLIITGASGPGVELVGEGGQVVAGCLLAGNQEGVRIRGAAGNRIGGPDRGDRNVIVENSAVGVLISGEGPDGNVVLGNFIGLDAAGDAAAFNPDGIRVDSGNGNRIGGLAPGEANWIAFNRLAGVFLVNGQGTVVRGNRIFANEELGIDLGQRGVTANDQGDADTGPNGLQNFPVLTAANVVTGGVRVVGTLNAAPGTAYDLDFYHNVTCDPSGNGEAALHFGSLVVTTDAAGNATFDGVLPAMIPRGTVTATATGPQGTSEASQCRALGTELPAATFLVTTPADDGPGSLRQAIRDANAAFTATPSTIAFNLSGTGVQIIQPLSPLPELKQAVEVDGFTQPGAAPAPPAEKLNHKILVRLDGEKAGAGADGLTVAGSGVSLRGLMFSRFAGRGLQVKPLGSVTLKESWVGTATGPTASPNGRVARQALPDPFAQGNGGGVYTEKGPVTIINSVISGNHGIGVNVDGRGGSLAISGSEVSANGDDGVSSLRAAIEAENSLFLNNGRFAVRVDFSELGGGSPSPQLVINNNVFSGNGSSANGGGIWINGGGATLFTSTLSNNQIVNNPGTGVLLMNVSGGPTITGSTISGNRVGMTLDVVTDVLIGTDPNNPVAEEMNTFKDNVGGSINALDTFLVSMFGNIFGFDNLPLNTSPTAPLINEITVDPGSGDPIIMGTVPVSPGQPTGTVTVQLFEPVTGEPACLHPAPGSFFVDVNPDGTVRTSLPPPILGDAVAVGLSTPINGSTVFLLNQPPGLNEEIRFAGTTAVVTGPPGAEVETIPGAGVKVTGVGNGPASFVIDLPDGDAVGPNAVTVVPGAGVNSGILVFTPVGGAEHEFTLQNGAGWKNLAQPEDSKEWTRFLGDTGVVHSFSSGPGELPPNYTINTQPGAGLTVSSEVDGGQFGDVITVLQSHSSTRQSLPFSVTVDGRTFDNVHTIMSTPLGTPSPTPKAIRTFTVQGMDSFFAFSSTFKGGVRVAAGDVNGDGSADLSVTSGPGGTTKVILNGALTLQPAFPGFPFFSGIGPVDGDLNADGVNNYAVNGGFSVRLPMNVPTFVTDENGNVIPYPAGTAAGTTLIPGGGNTDFGFGQTPTGDQEFFFGGSTVSSLNPNPNPGAVLKSTDGGVTWSIISGPPPTTFRPEINVVDPLVVGEGDRIQVNGRRFDPNPNNLCVVIMLQNGQAVPIQVTGSTGDSLTGTVGPVPPNALQGVLGLANGAGGNFPLSDTRTVGGWTSFQVDNDVMGPPVGLRPSTADDGVIKVFFSLDNGAFGGGFDFSGGVFVGAPLVRQAGPGTVTVPAGTVVGIIARAHDHTLGHGHDLAPFEVVFDTPVTLAEFATRICDALKDAFRRAAGLLINCTATITPPNRVDFAVSMANGRIDWGNLILIVRLPPGSLTSLAVGGQVANVLPGTGLGSVGGQASVSGIGAAGGGVRLTGGGGGGFRAQFRPFVVPPGGLFRLAPAGNPGGQMVRGGNLGLFRPRKSPARAARTEDSLLLSAVFGDLGATEARIEGWSAGAVIGGGSAAVGSDLAAITREDGTTPAIVAAGFAAFGAQTGYFVRFDGPVLLELNGLPAIRCDEVRVFPVGVPPLANLTELEVGGADLGGFVIVGEPSAQITLALTVRREGAGLVLQWDDPAAVLERAGTLNGTFAPVPNATSPHPVPVDAGESYFRLVRP